VLDNTTFDGVAKDYLTTTILDGFLPGIVKKFGEDQPASLTFRTKVAPNSYFSMDTVGAKVSAAIDFIVNNEKAVSLSVTDADATVKPALANFTLFIDILQFTVKAITIDESLIGEVNATELKVFLNVLFRLAIPVINQVMAGGLALPTEYFGVLVVKQAEFRA
jgi:hypothetical protein